MECKCWITFLTSIYFCVLTIFWPLCEHLFNNYDHCYSQFIHFHDIHTPINSSYHVSNCFFFWNTTPTQLLFESKLTNLFFKFYVHISVKPHFPPKLYSIIWSLDLFLDKLLSVKYVQKKIFIGITLCGNVHSLSSWAITFPNHQTNTWSSPCHSHSQPSLISEYLLKCLLWTLCRPKCKLENVTLLTVSVGSSIKNFSNVSTCLFCYACYFFSSILHVYFLVSCFLHWRQKFATDWISRSAPNRCNSSSQQWTVWDLTNNQLSSCWIYSDVPDRIEKSLDFVS